MPVDSMPPGEKLEKRGPLILPQRRETHMALKAPLAVSCTLRSSAAILHTGKYHHFFSIPSLRIVLLVCKKLAALTENFLKKILLY